MASVRAGTLISSALHLSFRRSASQPARGFRLGSLHSLSVKQHQNLLFASSHNLPSHHRNKRGVVAVASSSSDMSDAPVPVEDGSYEWDLVTIGVGSGGTRASRIAASFGAKVRTLTFMPSRVSTKTMARTGIGPLV